MMTRTTRSIQIGVLTASLLVALPGTSSAQDWYWDAKGTDHHDGEQDMKAAGGGSRAMGMDVTGIKAIVGDYSAQQPVILAGAGGGTVIWSGVNRIQCKQNDLRDCGPWAITSKECGSGKPSFLDVGIREYAAYDNGGNSYPIGAALTQVNKISDTQWQVSAEIASTSGARNGFVTVSASVVCMDDDANP